MSGIKTLKSKLAAIVPNGQSAEGMALVGRLMTIEEIEGVSGADTGSCGPATGYGMTGTGTTFGQTGGSFIQTGGTYTMDCTPPKGTVAA
jgi:hypothetical protein